MEEKFKNIIIYLADFPFFENRGKFLNNDKDRGFSGCCLLLWVMYHCIYGSLNSASACSHYNSAWQIHSRFLEGLEQCLYERFRHKNKQLKLTEMHVRLNNKFVLLTYNLLTCI